jgi:tetratricopeptide (TPR) repeat protein
MSDRARRRLLAALLVLGTLALYARTLSFGFVNLDDDVYVTANPRVLAGLEAESVGWAFTTGHAANWHPLTWLSHMLDVELFDLDAGGHHATSAVLHALAALLFFEGLARATGWTFPSFLAAAFFAWHPLRAESVAWVAERKDVLSGALFFAALLAYGAWTRAKTRGRTLLLHGLFVAGLLAKPMLVTFPFVCLLVDRWPLARTESLWIRLREKGLLLLLSLASAVATFLVQRSGGTTRPLAGLDLAERLANAVASVGHYVADLVWPARLACFYPHPAALGHPVSPNAPAFALGLAVLGVSALLAWTARRVAPSVLIGLCWFLGMLVPVIGIVQVGLQSHADRYTYLPSAGFAIALVFGVLQALDTRAARGLARPLAGLALAGLAALAFQAWRQIGTWRSSRTLFEHSLAVTKENFVAHSNLGEALEGDEDLAGARREYEASLEIAPHNGPGHYQLGRLLWRLGDREGALREYRSALVEEPGFDLARASLGIALSASGESEEAIRELGIAWEREPSPLSSADRAAAGQALAWALATSRADELRDGPRALAIAHECLRLAENRPSPALLETLAASAAEVDDFENAVAFEEAALRSIPPSGQAGARARLEGYRRGIPFRQP